MCSDLVSNSARSGKELQYAVEAHDGIILIKFVRVSLAANWIPQAVMSRVHVGKAKRWRCEMFSFNFLGNRTSGELFLVIQFLKK